MNIVLPCDGIRCRTSSNAKECGKRKPPSSLLRYYSRESGRCMRINETSEPKSRCRCRRGEPSPGAGVGGGEPRPGADAAWTRVVRRAARSNMRSSGIGLPLMVAPCRWHFALVFADCSFVSRWDSRQSSTMTDLWHASRHVKGYNQCQRQALFRATIRGLQKGDNARVRCR